jgi:hypothetical protein
MADELETEEEKKAKAKALLGDNFGFLANFPLVGSFTTGISSWIESLQEKLSETAFVTIASSPQLCAFMGVVPAEIPAKKSLLDQVASSPAFTDVATQLNLNPAVGDQLKSISTEAIKGTYTYTGMKKNPREVAKILNNTHGEIVTVLTDALIANGESETIAAAKASAAATFITGVYPQYLQSKHLPAHLKHKLPETGLANLLFKTQKDLTNAPEGAASIPPAALVMNTAALQEALLAAANLPATDEATAQIAADKAVAQTTTPVTPGNATSTPTSPSPTPSAAKVTPQLKPI